MAKKEKGFNTKIYAVIVFFTVAALLATITVTTFADRYNGFSAEKVATAYVESIVNSGDGYNAYKNALVSKNYKYGDYIREYYMYPIIYAPGEYKPGNSTDGIKGYNDESYMSEKTRTDTGALAGKVIDTMFPYYAELIKNNGGWDNYDVIFTQYFKKLVEVRESVFGDKYMTDEIMFTALESNVASYGDSLTGTEEIIDENTGLKTSEKTIGLYEKKFGENYRITYEVKNTQQVGSLADYTAAMDADTLSTYKVETSQINDAVTVTVDVKINGESVASVNVNVVQIGSTWYVDSTSTQTEALYKLAD